MKQYTLSQAQIIQIKQTFNYYATDNKIKKEQIPKILKALGQRPNPSQLKLIIQSMEFDKFDQCDFYQFLAMLSQRFKKQFSQQQMLEAFKSLDRQKNGTISLYQLKNTLTQYGDKMSEQQVDQILKYVPMSQGCLNYEELIHFLNKI